MFCQLIIIYHKYIIFIIFINNLKIKFLKDLPYLPNYVNQNKINIIFLLIELLINFSFYLLFIYLILHLILM